MSVITEIKITAAIEKRKNEIKQLMALRKKAQRLIDDSVAAEKGMPCMSRKDWEQLKREVEDVLWELELARLHRGMIPALSSVSGIPAHWSQAIVT